MENLLNTSMHDLFSSHPYVVGGAAAGILFYLVTNVIQFVAVYKLARKVHCSTVKTLLLSVIVFIPFGIELSLLIIAYTKEHEHHEAKLQSESE